jgi:hypothetical protein
VSGNYNVYNNITFLNPGSGSNITGTAETDPSTTLYNSDGSVKTSAIAPTGYGMGVWIHEGSQNVFSNITGTMRGSVGLHCGLMINGNIPADNSFSDIIISGGRPAIYLSGIKANSFTNITGKSAQEYNLLIDENADTLTLEGFKSIQGGFGGIRCLEGCDGVVFQGGYAINALADGYRVNSATNVHFRGVVSTGNTGDDISLKNTSGPPTNCSIIDCITDGSIISNGTGHVIRGNTNFTTENGGVSSAIASGGTIAHGCDLTPTKISVSPADSGVTDFYATVDVTNITVTYSGGGTHAFNWHVEF